MQLIPQAMVATFALGVAVAGTIVERIPAPAPPATAMVRFTNNMASNATLSANGTVLFADTESTRTTGWAQVQDSTVTFTLTVSGQEGQTATTTEKMADGGQYTVSAAPGTEGRPMLTVTKEPKDPVKN